jgi:SAM-dependent methyltransferase
MIKNNLKSKINLLLDDQYILERLEPKFGDLAYLHLSDLLLALSPALKSAKGSLLDFGCGGSPYRSLFTGSIYHRADIPAGVDNIDFEIDRDSKIDANNESYDVVLATQVLEHVPDPASYLKEACRILKPGGKLLLSTHGAFFDHACPNDFHRWTTDGLALEMRKAGFEIEKMQKLTLGARAVFFLGENKFGSLWDSRTTLQGWGLWFFQNFFWINRSKRHQWVDKNFPTLRVADSTDPEPLYICIFATAVKPI